MSGFIYLGGPLGNQGSFSPLGFGNPIFTSASANHSATLAECSGALLNVTSSVSMTGTYQLVLPLVQGMEWDIVNNTTGGHSITVGGSSGSTVTIANGATDRVACADGANFVSIGGSGSAAGGSLAGAYPNPTVIQVDGSGTTNDFGGSGASVPIVATETTLGSSTGAPVKGFVDTATTTDGATWVTIASYAVPVSQLDDWSVSLAGIDAAYGGAFYRADFSFTTCRASSGAAVLYPSSPVAVNVRYNGTGSTYTIQVVLSGSTIDVQVKGNTGTTVHWTCLGQDQRAT